MAIPYIVLPLAMNVGQLVSIAFNDLAWGIFFLIAGCIAWSLPLFIPALTLL
jgi:hypothetical protein